MELLRREGFEVTQATVSRDIAELGLVKVPREDRHIYATAGDAASGNAYDARLRRLLEDIPVRVGRSGLSLVLLATPGSAGAIAQAIDQSSLTGSDRHAGRRQHPARPFRRPKPRSSAGWSVSRVINRPAPQGCPPYFPTPCTEAPR